MNVKKKGLVVVYDPHNLYQFLWYYCSYGEKKSWDALCLPNDLKGEYMSEYCEATGIFNHVFHDETEFAHLSALKKMFLFLKMLIYASFHKQTVFCKKLMRTFVDIDSYDTIVVLNDIGIVSGACIALGIEKKVIILEDGDADYLERNNKQILKEYKNMKVWQGFFLANLGYANPAHFYPLKTTAYCEKFCSKPNQMHYKNYKTLHRLYDYSNTNMVLFDEVVASIYPEIKDIDFEHIDTVFFTYTFQDFVKNGMPFVIKTQQYLNGRGKSILLKQHPMDKVDYKLAGDVRVQTVPSSIPAEVLIKYLHGKDIIMGGMSSILRYMDVQKYSIEVLYFEGLREVCLQDNMYLVLYQTLGELDEKMKKYETDNIKITVL